MDINKANYVLGKAIAGFQDDEIEDLSDVFADIEDPDLEGLDEAKRGGGTPMQCLECGAKFKKKIGPKTTEVKCPKCGSYDTDLA
jgi:hypothetical protein